MIRRLYPANWEAIALEIKTECNWTCEECRRPCRRPGEDDGALCDRIEVYHSEWAIDLSEEQQSDLFGLTPKLKLGRFTLTVAHLDHRPENCDRSNLRAWCSVCHCRYDLKAMKLKQWLKAQRAGQMSLLD